MAIYDVTLIVLFLWSLFSILNGYLIGLFGLKMSEGDKGFFALLGPISSLIVSFLVFEKIGSRRRRMKSLQGRELRENIKQLERELG